MNFLKSDQKESREKSFYSYPLEKYSEKLVKNWLWTLKIIALEKELLVKSMKNYII